MKLYIYENESMELSAIINAEDNAQCEAVANEQYGDTDLYGWTYSPAFGFDDGVIENADAEEIDA